MGVFSGLSKLSGQKKQSVSGPVFLKPYAPKDVEMRALAEKLEAAPPQSKYLFREAHESLRAQSALHAEIAQMLSGLNLPMQMMHDLRVSSRAGLARIDFVVVTTDFILSIQAQGESEAGESRQADRINGDGQYEGDQKAEETAYFLYESLRESGIVSGKALSSIWPVKILSKERMQRQAAYSRRAFSSDFSGIYPEVQRAQLILKQELEGLIKALFDGAYAPVPIPEKKIHALCAHLIAYDEAVNGCSVSAQTDK